MAAVALSGQAALAAEEGFKPLFDGKTLQGWTELNGTAKYWVEDGAIVGRTSEGSPNSFLCTDEEYGDFELRFEVKVDDGLNSGAQIRSAQREASEGRFPEGRVYGPQVEIESGPGQAGWIYGEATGRGWVSPEPRLDDPKVNQHDHFRSGEWNAYRVVAEGPRIRVWINGHAIADLVDEEIYQKLPDGFIGLQVHSIRKGTGPFEARWRNLRLREL